MKKLILAAALTFFSFTASASWDDWDSTDKALGATALTLTAVDMLQTVYISKNGDRFHETNPILGEHPSTGKVYGYFAASAVAGYLIMDSLPPNWRKAFAGGAILLEANMVTRNYQLGIKMSF